MVVAPSMIGWMQALSDSTRARLLRLLERAELTVAELCAVVQLPQSTVSRHLKVLAEDGWLDGRRQGTNRYYHLAAARLESGQRRLWSLVREQTMASDTARQDDQRLEQVLVERRTRSQEFFSSTAGQWDRMRHELFGKRFDAWALAALVDGQAVVGELGCGTAPLSEYLCPFVRKVIAVDQSTAMLDAARARLAGRENVQLRQGELDALPLEDGELDVAAVVLVLPYLAEPAAVFGELARVVRPGGRLVLVDLLPHDRREYQQEMGHLWLGFDRSGIESWLSAAGFSGLHWVVMPPDPEAKGPALFAAVARLSRVATQEPLNL